MRGVTFLGGRQLQVTAFPDPSPGPHDVVVGIKASGMCGSDLKFYRAAGEETAALGLGKLEGPVIAGHEPCGVVAAVGGTVYGVTAHGAHADYMKVPAHTLVPLPDQLSFATGAAVSCGTGTAYGALRRM